MQRWKTQLPLSTPSFTFPNRLHEVDWADTRAIWRVFCNRAPTDPPPIVTADPCPRGTDLTSSHDLLQECPLLATQRATLQTATTGDIRTPQFIIAPENSLPLRSSVQPAWATPHTSASRRTNLHHKAAKTQNQTRLNQTSALSKIKRRHGRHDVFKEGQTGKRKVFLCFLCIRQSVSLSERCTTSCLFPR